jgi:hypothetical protein
MPRDYKVSSCESQQSQKKQSQETHELSRGLTSTTLVYLHVVASQWTRVALNPFQVIHDQLEYHGVLLSLLFPVCEESPQLGVSRPYNEDQSESTRVKEGSNTHKSTSIRTHTAKT